MERKTLVYFDHWADPIAEEILAGEPSIELVRLSLNDPPATIWKALERAHGYQWPRPPYLGNRELIARCTNLLAMASQGSGCDVMDFDACNEAGVMIVNQAGLGGREAVASHALAMMLALSKQLIQSDRAMREQRRWDRLSFIGEDLTERTVGIIGFGNIGSRLAEMCAAAFRMRVLAYDPYLDEAEIAGRGGIKMDLPTLLGQADYVSVHCPLTAETAGMLGAREFAQMKRGAYFVTTARGGIHDEPALAQALASGHLAGAGLDVWMEEPPDFDNPLLRFGNVVVSAHIAGVTRRAYRSVAEAAARQWITIFAEQRPPRLVNPEVWPRYRERHERIFGRPPSG
jgi:D-3-phosphoglycerate dehydrogenase